MRQTKPIVWFILSGIWCVAGLVDVFDHYAPLSIGFKFQAALAFCGLGIGQFCFDKQGARGKKAHESAVRGRVCTFDRLSDRCFNSYIIQKRDKKPAGGKTCGLCCLHVTDTE